MSDPFRALKWGGRSPPPKAEGYVFCLYIVHKTFMNRNIRVNYAQSPCDVFWENLDCPLGLRIKRRLEVAVCMLSLLSCALHSSRSVCSAAWGVQTKRSSGIWFPPPHTHRREPGMCSDEQGDWARNERIKPIPSPPGRLRDPQTF